MIDRLKKILDYYELSASNFADRIDVPRSSISHLLSGRNKASLDFVMKVVDNFEDVELNWLVYGKGTFPKADEVIETPPSSNQFNLFTDTESKEVKTESVKQQPKLLKVILLYENGGFEEFKNL